MVSLFELFADGWRTAVCLGSVPSLLQEVCAVAVAPVCIEKGDVLDIISCQGFGAWAEIVFEVTPE